MIKNIQSQSITLVMFLLCIFCKAQNNELLYETYYESDMIKKLSEKVFKMPNLKTVSIHVPSDSAAQVIFKQLEKVKPFQVLHVTGGNFNYFSALGGGQLGRWPKPPAFQHLGTFQTSSDTALLGRLHTESQTSYFSLILLGYTNLTRLRAQLPKYCIKDHHK